MRAFLLVWWNLPGENKQQLIICLSQRKEPFLVHNPNVKLAHSGRWYKWMELTHITRLSCPFGQPVQSGFLPEMSSRRTTPKAYTSILLFTLPCMKYSGAKYLSKYLYVSKSGKQLLQCSKRCQNKNNCLDIEPESSCNIIACHLRCHVSSPDCETKVR